MADVELKLNDEKLMRVWKKCRDKFLSMVRDAWSKEGHSLIGEVVREQLSGRRGGMGLDRRSGNAARAMNVVTKKTSNDVIQKFFVAAANPAKHYLFVHDKVREKLSGDISQGKIKAKNKPWLVFQVGGQWRRAKEVTIPQRTDVVGTIDRGIKKRYLGSVDSVIDRLLHA